MLPAQRRAVTARVVAGVVVTVAAFFVARWAHAPLFEKPMFLGGEDGMRHFEAARASFARGDHYPLWDRTSCGGTPGLADPESLFASSFVAGLFRIHGDVVERWYPVLAAALGIVGAYLWCRRALSLGRVASFWAGAVFVASGFVSLQAAGRMHFVPFYFIPWVLYFAHRGEDDHRYAGFAGLVMALMVFEGGMLPLVEACIALLLVTLPRFARRATGPWPAARMLLVVALAFVLVAGVKLYPVIVQMARFPGHSRGDDQLKWAELMPIFIDKERFDPLAGHRWHINEYRAYVGPLVLGSAIAGAGTAIVLSPRRWGLVLLLLGGLTLTRGAYSPSAPYPLLSQLLTWNVLILPSRFVVLACLGVAACGAVAIDKALDLVAHRRALALVVLAVAFVGIWDPVVEGNKIFKAQPTEPWLPRPDPIAKPFALVGEDLHRVAEFPARNVGAVACQRVLDMPGATGFALGEVPQAWPEAPEAGKLADVVTSQNGYRFHAKMARMATVHVNTSWDPDWSTNVGTIQRNANGMLDVKLPAGETDVVLSYSPRGFVAGIVASIFGLLGLAALFVLPAFLRRRGKKRPATVAVAGKSVVETKIAA